MKKYESPELEIVVFSTEDIITTSLILSDDKATDENTGVTPWF
jgi:hypothetical protein